MAEHSGHSESHGISYYVKIWVLLLVLLIVSIVGPMFEIRSLTLLTAFGIAIVKALVVAAYFMHLNIEKKYIWYILLTMMLMVTVFFFGTAGDTMKVDGNNWINQASERLIQEHEIPKGAGEAQH